MARHRTMAAVVAVAAALAGTAVAPPARAAQARYTNPVTAAFTDTFADPSVLRGQDGAWYAYGTEDSPHAGEPPARVPIARSTDLTHWTHAGDAFGAPPAYADPATSYWAPDIRFLDGRYTMYYTVTNTKASTKDGDFAIGVATAPTPAGPWTQADQPVVPPVTDAAGNYLTVIDPDELTAADGTKYLYYGSYTLGVHVVPLTPDGLHAAGPPRQVTTDNRYEGSYVVRHGGWYYLMASSANCCAGPTSGYAVFAGRSTSPLGPFTDRDGVRLDASRVGGTPVISPQGNRWVGTGHNAVLTDDAGQDWLVYHAIDRDHPYLGAGADGVNRRPMLIDRLDWIDGWPTVRAGAGASDGPQQAPVSTGPVHDTFAAGLPPTWHRTAGTWTPTGTADTGYLTTTTGGTLLNGTALPGPLQARADVRARGGATAGLLIGHTEIAVDATHHTLVVRDGTTHRTASTPLPATVDPATWHQLSARVAAGTLTADLTEAGLPDPVATLTVPFPTEVSGHLGLTATGPADADNVVAAPASRPVTHAVATPRAGAPLPAYSDEFTNGLSPAWSWVRRDQAATVADGALTWPTEAPDLSDGTDTAGVLLRDPPPGDYLVETKVSMDTGTDTVRNYEQAGLVAYVADGDFARLDQVAIGDTRQVEFARSLPYAGRRAWGGNLVGTQAATTWLRLARWTDPTTHNQVFRAASSTDGTHWTWGGAWTFTPTQHVRIGLVSQGGNTPPATARFDYLHTYRLADH